ncbi:unnamed protein product [Rotaria sp. Silwood1]|nr:unnamed protein product [Rotaria sp. Silwood1]CAF1404338.1 unnamed protein product [Rotaria sp. Silwood1]CAF3583000.1 unnamed protein product [Rotaria sp. Silwood1]CAF4529680.1 unnamed protein product [Rotaria sp. Silwood1]
MAKSFFRNVTDQITGGISKTTDVQIVQAVNHFEDEHSKLLKFRREFDKYTQAILLFDNASFRFFDFMRSLTDSSWPHQSTVDQLCVDIGRTRNEHLQHLNKQTISNINISLDAFEKMKGRIVEQCRIQHDYDKTRKQYQTSLKREEQIKIDRIKNEIDQLKSALNLINCELREDLGKFHLDLQNHHRKTIIDLFGTHGDFYRNSYKLCSYFVERLRGNPSMNSANTNNNNNNDNDNEHDSEKEIQSSTDDSNKKKPDCISLSQPKRTYKILHEAHVIHDYEAENEDELNLVKGEYISIISFYNEEDNIRDEGWEYAEKSDGTIGLFPVNFAVRLYDNEEKQ